MLFNSWIFVGLVIASAIIYYLPFLRRGQVYVLLAASFVFYAYDSPGLLGLLVASGIVNAVASYGAMYRKASRTYATAGVVVNLVLLALFKYGGLIASSFLDVNSGVGHVLCRLPLPLGISFYTFSGISLVVDSYKGRFDQSSLSPHPTFLQHLRRTLLYICFFPKLLAGPIAKSKDFFEDIAPKQFRQLDWQFVFKSLVVGYFLKMVVADNLKDFTFWMAYPYFQQKGTGDLLLMVFGYSIQIFADFAGYSLIAIGVAAIFGYRLPTNFYFPYIASSFREFWKRWHITLSQFLMEYLYFSLGGNRKGKARTYLNLLLTMMLGGLWHGAAWSYLVWGTYHGLCLTVERFLCGKRQNCIEIGTWRQVSHWLSIAFVFVLVSFGWLLFKLPNFTEASLYMKSIFHNWHTGEFISKNLLLYILLYSLPVVLYHAIYLLREKPWLRRYVLRYDYVLYGIMLFLLLTNSGSANSFVYFQF